MSAYILRGVSAVVAVFYAVIAVGLSYIPALEQPADDLLQPVEASQIEQDELTVHVLQGREEIGFTLQQVFDLYSINLPKKVQFSTQTVGSESDYHSTLRARLLAGESTDLFQISGAQELLELEKYIQDLDFLPWVMKAYPGTLDAVTNNNQVFGVPYSIEGFGLICNRDIFNEAEIPLTEIRNIEELTVAFTKLNEKIISGELQEKFGLLEAVCEFPAQDKNFLGEGFADIAISGAFESPIDAALSQTANFPAAEPVEQLVKLMARFSANNGDWTKLAKVTDAMQIERFANGRVAVILQDTNVYLRVNELNPEMQGRAFLLPVPLDAFEMPNIYMGAPAYWVINSASAQHTSEAAGDFLEWLYRSDEGAECLASQFGAVSPFRDMAKSTGVALHSQMLNYLDAGMSLPQLHREFPQGWGKNMFAPNVQSYFTNREKTWNDVIIGSMADWQALRQS